MRMSTALARRCRGLSLSNLQRHERAIADYSKAIELDEKYEIAWNNRGFSNFNLARYQESLADYTRAIALDSQYSHPLNNRYDMDDWSNECSRVG